MTDQRKTKEGRILKKAAEGDANAIRHLVKAHSDLAYTVAVKLLDNPEDAEEVVQDSFMKAFVSLNRFKNSSKFSTWLYRIVYNTALTKIKKRTRGLSFREDLPADIGGLQVRNKGWEELLKSEKLKYIDMAMNGLSEEDRLIFTLHYTGGKTISEINGILNLKKSAIKMRLSRGRKLLKVRLELLLGNETKELL